MSIFDIFNRHPKPTDGPMASNTASIASFEAKLDQYEAMIKPTSSHFDDYRQPANCLKEALVQLTTANPADSYSMLRRMMARITGKIDDEYSDYSLSMMTAATRDQDAKHLISAIVHIARELINNERVELGEGWLRLVGSNMAILTFFENYARSDQTQSDTYSGEPGAWFAKEVEKSVVTDAEYTLEIGYANYDISLKNGEQQKISLSVVPDIRKVTNTPEGDRLILSSEVVLTPSCGSLIIDKSVGFYDDARAQINALHISPAGVIAGCDTRIIMPGLFYSLMMHAVSHDEGLTWRVAEVNVLPPSLTRQ